MNVLNFKHLFYFMVVAKEGSIKSAAEKLNVTQPTISDQIKLLEDFLESQLFERKNRSLFLTKEGQLALEYAERIFKESQELTHRLKNKVRLPKRSIDIGIGLNMSYYFLYDTIMPLFENGELAINIKEGERLHLLADLESEDIDLLFTDNKESISTALNSFRIGVNKTYAIAHRKYQKYKRKFPQGLSEIPFINYSKKSFIRFEIDLFFARNDVLPKVVGEADDIELLQVATESGLAFTIVPEIAKNRICRNKDIIVLGELKELQASVWGIIKSDYKGLGYQLLKSCQI